MKIKVGKFEGSKIDRAKVVKDMIESERRYFIDCVDTINKQAEECNPEILETIALLEKSENTIFDLTSEAYNLGVLTAAEIDNIHISTINQKDRTMKRAVNAFRKCLKK